MNIMITGHRKQKLSNYNMDYINSAIYITLEHILSDGIKGYVCGFSGMASGIDLIFCQACIDLKIPFVACVPFAEQNETMDAIEQAKRDVLLKEARKIYDVRNGYMIEQADVAIVIWDGNKGGTHNCIQQIIEKNIPFYWINPVGQKIINCSASLI